VDALESLMEVKVRLRALRIRGLEAGPGRLVFTLGPDAALDGFQLAKLVQKSEGAIRLTPEMKLVAQLGPGGKLASRPAGKASGAALARARARGDGASVAAKQALARAAAPLGVEKTAAMEEAEGRELLQAVRDVLQRLRACAVQN
jgi:transcription-repair coupling factor (superfamily II helicase)